MNPKYTREDIWKWHLIMEDYLESGLTQADYCKRNDIIYRDFTNMYYRIVFKSRGNPEEHKRLIPIARECMRAGVAVATYAKKVGEDRIILNSAVMHLRCLDTIKEMKAEKTEEKPEMKFIAVNPERNVSAQAEVIEPQNDIELTISKGIKVSIAPNIDSMKIVRIIELLKDL